jgi:hypothetical protein
MTPDQKRTMILFFDFYSIYDLYLRCGGYREIGYTNYPVIINQRGFDKIEEKYNDVVNNMYSETYKALVYSIQSELRHFPYCCHSSMNHFCRINNVSKEDVKIVKKDVEKNFCLAYTIFDKGIWDYNYGGKKWAKATKMLIESKNINTIHKKVWWCDRVLDLHHNTGHLLNKTDFNILSKYVIKTRNRLNTPLDFRATSESVFSFINFISFDIKNLLMPQSKLYDNDMTPYFIKKCNVTLDES